MDNATPGDGEMGWERGPICPRFSRVKIAVAKETREGETRVAMVPELVGKLTALGYDVAVEPGAGQHALISDEEYDEAGATLDRRRAGRRRRRGVGAAPGPGVDPPAAPRRDATISFLPTSSEQAAVVELRDAGITLLRRWSWCRASRGPSRWTR